MHFDVILSFLFVGILPSYIYLKKYPTTYQKPRGFVFSCVLLLFPIIIFTLYQMMPNRMGNWKDFLLAGTLTLGFNYLALTGRIAMNKLLKSALALLFFFFGSLIQFVPIFLFSIPLDAVSPVVETYLTLFSDTFLVTVLGFMYYDEIKSGILLFKKNFNEIFDTAFKYWLLGFIGMVVSNLFISLLFPSAVSGNEDTIQGMISVSPWIMLITAGLIGPIVEELVFRQAFKDVILPPKVYVLSSGIIFGLLHVIFAYTSLLDFIYVIPYSALGISFAYTVYKTDNITSSMIMHILHNSFVVGLSILSGLILL